MLGVITEDVLAMYSEYPCAERARLVTSLGSQRD
jgi:hypothetical protein